MQVSANKRLKKFVAIVALLGILLQTFNQFVIVAQFYANRAYIAKTLCENRDKPQLHCEGQCCLKKRLAQEAKEQSSSNTQKSRDEVLLYCSITTTEIKHPPVFTVPQEFVEQNEFYLASYTTPVFHPPSFAA